MGGSDPNINTNLYLSRIKLPVLLCPSDSGSQTYPSANSTYGCGVTDSVRSCYGFSVSQGQGVGSSFWKDINRQQRALFGLNSNSEIRDIVDGTSNSVAFVETTLEVYDGRTQSWACSSHVGEGVSLMAPRGINNWTCCSWQSPPWQATPIVGRNGEWGEPGSLHAGGIQVLMADGSVRFLSQNLAYNTVRYLGFIADGQVLGEF